MANHRPLRVTLALERFADVLRVRMSSLGSRAAGLDVSAYVVRGIMIDTGFHRAGPALLAAARSLGVRGVIVTHWHEDHAGNVERLAASGLPVMLRPETERTLRARPAIPRYRRLVWGHPPPLRAAMMPVEAPALATLHTPGHSTDHQVVFDRETGTLFSGDLWLGVRARVLHASEDPYQIVESLRAALALDAVRMFDAHRGLVDRPAEAIRAKIDWMGETLGTIERRVADGWSDRAIVRSVLGGEERAAIVSRGDYARRNFVRAVRRRTAGASPACPPSRAG